MARKRPLGGTQGDGPGPAQPAGPGRGSPAAHQAGDDGRHDKRAHKAPDAEHVALEQHGAQDPHHRHEAPEPAAEGGKHQPAVVGGVVEAGDGSDHQQRGGHGDQDAAQRVGDRVQLVVVLVAGLLQLALVPGEPEGWQGRRARGSRSSILVPLPGSLLALPGPPQARELAKTSVRALPAPDHRPLSHPHAQTLVPFPALPVNNPAHQVVLVEVSVTSFIHSSQASKSSLQRSSWKVWGLNQKGAQKMDTATIQVDQLSPA